MRTVKICFDKIILGQVRVSRNIGESWRQRILRVLWSTVYTLKAVKLALLAMREEQLGSQVMYRGRKCFISNWAGGEFVNVTDGNGFYKEQVPRDEILSVISLSELLHRFRVMLVWYITNWLQLDVQKRLTTPQE